MIGSGIGGLSVASILSRAGKKVLVLEQHDIAGGNFHVFSEKGFEFDTGIKYLFSTRTFFLYSIWFIKEININSKLRIVTAFT